MKKSFKFYHNEIDLLCLKLFKRAPTLVILTWYLSFPHLNGDSMNDLRNELR